jgi:hypothetical protein
MSDLLSIKEASKRVLLYVSVKGSFKSPWEDLDRPALPPFPLQLLRAFSPSGVDREESLVGVRAGKLSKEIDRANCDETQHYQEKSQGESGHQTLRGQLDP